MYVFLIASFFNFFYSCSSVYFTFAIIAMLVGAFLQASWGLSAGYQPRPQVVDRGTTARYGGQLRYI